MDIIVDENGVNIVHIFYFIFKKIGLFLNFEKNMN